MANNNLGHTPSDIYITRAAGLPSYLNMYHRLSLQFIPDFQHVAQTILTLQSNQNAVSMLTIRYSKR